ncbi:MAG: hypothetical protein AB7F78_25795 [Hyphomicrobiaceae bacterium]
MNAVRFIAVWGIISIVSAVVAGIVAAARNRDHSWWAAWSFIFPPMLVILILLPPNKGPRPRRPSMDDEDRREWI